MCKLAIFKNLRWLETVSSTFQDLSVMGHYNHSISVDTKVMVSKNCPIIGEQATALAQ